MNYDLAFKVAVAVALISLAFATIMQLQRSTSRRRKSALRLRAAARALGKHYDDLAKLVDDPATPQAILRVALDFSDIIDNKERSIAVLECLSLDPYLGNEGNKDPLWVEVEKLRSHRRDLYDAFIGTLVKGMAAMAVRWPETLATFEANVDRVVTSDRKDVAIAQRATQWAPTAAAKAPLVPIAA